MATIGSLSVVLTASSGAFIGGLSKAQGALQSFGGNVKAFSTSFQAQFTGLKGVAVGLGASFVNLGRSSIDVAADFERTEIAMAAMIGSATTAKKLLEDLVALDIRTPFTITELKQSAQGLLSYGFAAEEIIPVLERMGNLAAASPFGGAEAMGRMTVAIGQMRSKTRVMTQEMNQLTEAGASGVWEALAKRLGTDVAGAMKRVELGTVSARDGIGAMLDLAESPKFRETMAMQSKGLEGLRSSLEGTKSLFRRDLGRILIEGFDIKGITIAFTNFVNHVRVSLDGLRPTFLLIGTAFRAAFDAGLIALRGVITALRNFGLSIDAGPGRLTALREMIISAFESAAQGIGRAIIHVRNFGFTVLEFVVAPLLQAADAFLTFAADLKRGAEGNDKLNVFDELATRVGVARTQLLNFVREFRGLREDVFEQGIGQFFDRVRAAPLRQFGEQLQQIAAQVMQIRKAFHMPAPGDQFVAAFQAVGIGLDLAKKAGLLGQGGKPLDLKMADMAHGVAERRGPGSGDVFSQETAQVLAQANARTMAVAKDPVVKAIDANGQQLQRMAANLAQIAAAVVGNGLAILRKD